MSKENHTMALESEEIEILERREAVRQGVPLFTAHWQIFAPSVVILALYLIIWAMLLQLGQASSGTGRLFVVTMAVLTPLLGAWAFLRYQTIRLQVSKGHLLVHPGWPREIPADIPQEFVQSVGIHRGILGRIFGGGTLSIKLSDGRNIVVPDLAKPDEAKQSVLHVSS